MNKFLIIGAVGLFVIVVYFSFLRPKLVQASPNLGMVDIAQNTGNAANNFSGSVAQVSQKVTEIRETMGFGSQAHDKEPVAIKTAFKSVVAPLVIAPSTAKSTPSLPARPTALATVSVPSAPASNSFGTGWNTKANATPLTKTAPPVSAAPAAKIIPFAKAPATGLSMVKPVSFGSTSNMLKLGKF